MALDPRHLSDGVLAFLDERHLADAHHPPPRRAPTWWRWGSLYDPEAALVRIITFAPEPQGPEPRGRPRSRAAACQVDGGRWLTLEAPAAVRPTSRPCVAEGVRRYAQRYREPGSGPTVVIEIAVHRVLGRA